LAMAIAFRALRSILKGWTARMVTVREPVA